MLSVNALWRGGCTVGLDEVLAAVVHLAPSSAAKPYTSDCVCCVVSGVCVVRGEWCVRCVLCARGEWCVRGVLCARCLWCVRGVLCVRGEWCVRGECMVCACCEMIGIAW